MEKSSRGKHERVKSAKGRKKSSTRWLERQLNDPYVKKANMDGYRSRAAYKLLDLNDKFRFLKPGMNILDLGAAPGGWCQVCAEICGGKSRIIGLDLLEMDFLSGVEFAQMDFLAEDAPEQIMDMLGGDKLDLVISDMAPNTTGHKQTDHLRIMALCEEAAAFAFEVLKPGGGFVAKVFQGGADKDLLNSLKKNFEVVKHAKPDSSRKDSSESYVVALGFKENILRK